MSRARDFLSPSRLDCGGLAGQKLREKISQPGQGQENEIQKTE